jgi:hypothetical protein
MIQVLNATTKSIEAVMSGVAGATEPSFTAAWADDTGSAFTEGATDGALNGTTPVTLVAAPAAATRRTIKSITICNIDNAPVTITVSYNDNATLRSIVTVTLAVGDTWTLDGTYTSTGTFKSTTATVNVPGGSNTQLQYNNNSAFGGISGATTNGTVVTLTSGLATTAFSPSSTDGAALGSTGAQFADLFLAEGGVINWDNGDATITQTNNVIAVAGISDLTISGNITPAANDGGALGSATVSWSDLFLASGALINIANGNWVATHTSGILTITTGELRITSANVGTNADSVPTLSSTSTLTNKTLTAPTLGGATSLADGATIKLIVPTADGTATGPTTAAFVSGYTSSAIGDLVILDSSGKWQKTDANTASIYNGMLGVALAVAATDAALLVALPGSIVYATAFPTMTIGAAMYMSETAGVITATAPTTTDSATRIIGYAVHADKIFFNPSNDYITHT